MTVLSTRIVLDCFYLLIFYSEKFSTDVCRLPYAVNVNLNLSSNTIAPCKSCKIFLENVLHKALRFNHMFNFLPRNTLSLTWFSQSHKQLMYKLT